LIVPFIASAINAQGGRARDRLVVHSNKFSKINTDAVVIVGGMVPDENDKSVLTLARMGEVVMHGMGIRRAKRPPGTNRDAPNPDPSRKIRRYAVYT
jgi:hypothetical protein